MKIHLLFVGLLCPFFCQSQQQPQVWFFGYNAGIDFSSGSPVSFSGSSMSQWEGVATACDTAGNLEFYSDGITVYDANNQVMPNGAGLLGDPSSTHSATVVPMPGDPDQYYLFTCPELNSTYGLRYSIIDMTLNGGLGDVTATKNVLLIDSTTEQCVVIPNINGCVWLVTRKYTPVWYAYPIDTGGIQTPVISVAGSYFDKLNANGVGYMKVSPLNNKIAIANYGYSYVTSFFEIYDFNDTTGEVSNPFQLYLGSPVYGCSFSPDGTRFYGPEWGMNIYQFDLTAGSPTDIANSQTLIGTAGGAVGDLQIGPDQKIYCAINGGNYLSAINNPNALGTNCDFQSNGVYLGGLASGIGLPSILIFSDCTNSESLISLGATDTSLCEKFCIDFFDSSQNNPSAWQWIFPGGIPSSSIDQNPANICYNLPGTYDVTLITTSASGNDTLTLSNYITVYATPPFPSITQEVDTLTSSPASSYQWQFNSADIPGATNQSYTVTQSGLYTVVVGDLNGCENSFSIKVFLSGIEDVTDDTNISIYPNPTSGSFTVEWLNACPAFCGGLMVGEISIDIINTLGQKVFSSSEKISSTDWKKGIDLHQTARGVYFIEIKTKNESVRKKILITD